jgi:cell division septation protein DedD
MISCEQKNTNSSYRIVGKNGKAIYIDRRVPKLNEEYLAKKNSAKKSGQKPQQQTDGDTVSSTPFDRIGKSTVDGGRPTPPESKIIPSSAYNIKSVIDNDTDYENATALSVNNVDTVKNAKTIEDFGNLPRNYFSDDRQSPKILSKSKYEDKNTPKTTVNSKPQSKITEGKGLYYVQLGLFVNKNNAEELFEKFVSAVPTLKIRNSKTKNGKNSYIVIAGGFSSRADLEETIKKIQSGGHREIYTFKE